MRAAIYARYSTDLQSDASIEDQLEVCRRYVEGKGWTPVKVFADRAVSGANATMRPEYLRMVADIEAGKIDVIVAEALDRIGRNLADVAALHDRLEFKRVALHTVATGEVSTMHIGLLGTMAQLFLADLRAKTKRGLAGRIRAGRSSGGRCYGYDIVEGAERGLRRINAAEAEVVRRIFHLFAEGMSAIAIAKLLNREGILGPGGRPWSDGTIRGNIARATGILNNELYIGRLVWNRVSRRKDPRTGHRQPSLNPVKNWETMSVPDMRIVDEALWKRVKTRQKALSFATAVKTSNTGLNSAHRQRFLLSGLLVCGVCGGRYAVVDKANYSCSTRRHKGTCPNKKFAVRADMESRVLDGLKSKLVTPELFKVFAVEYIAETNRLAAKRSKLVVDLERDLAEVERKIATIVAAIESGKPPRALTERLTSLEERKTQIEADLIDAKARQTPIRLHPNLPDVYARKVGELENLLLDNRHRTEAMSLIRSLIDKIVLTPKGNRLEAVLHGDLARILEICDCSAGGKTRGKPAAACHQLSGGSGSRTMTM